MTGSAGRGPSSEQPTLLELTGAGAPASLVGGKGEWLDRLIAAGFAVPSCLALTTAAYRLVAAEPGLKGFLAEVSAGPIPPQGGHQQARDSADAAFLGVPLPDAVAAAIAAACSLRDPGGLLVARSSATAEDLPGASFAGQYRSYLGVPDDAGLGRAIRLVWASLWYPEARAYRRFHGIAEQGLAMAVVVMRQVPAQSAGVAFTVDPAGATGFVRVETVPGLGEGLVSGAVTPAVHLVPRRATGMGAEPEVDPLAAEVAALALRVEAAFGEPQDVEWARDAAGLWVLQARPATGGSGAGDGFDTAGAEDRRWTTSGIAEMVPGVLPPLRWEVVHLLLEEAVRQQEDRHGVLPVDALAGRDLLGRVRGRAALDADLVERLSANARRRVGRLASLGVAGAGLVARRRALWEAGTTTVAAQELLSLAPELASLPDMALLAFRRRVIDLTGRAMTAEVAVAAEALAAYARLERTLTHHLEDAEARSWAARVTARPGGTVAGWPQQALAEALRAAPADAVAALAAADGWASARASLAGEAGGPALIDRVEAVIRGAGSAAVVGGPTWDERPALLWPPLRALAAQVGDGRLASRPEPGEATALDDLLDGLAANPEWRQTRLLTLQVADLRRPVIRRQAEDAADLLERRERAKAGVLALGGVLRRVHLEAGRRLAERGRLEQAEDVELLGERELRDALAGPTGAAHGPRPSPTQAELARRRRWLARCEEAGPLPAEWSGGPPPHVGGLALPGEVLTGWGASPGRISGPVRVLESSDEGGLVRGEVLVTRTTDASWAPLLMVAAAVVVEEGGPLSHAAIVARELGIPAVVHVPGVVARLSGVAAMVTVDGDAGTVAVAALEVP